MQNRIYIFNTHYEIYGYKLGDFPELERDLTYKNRVTHKRVPKYYYDKTTRILYVPRGYDNAKLITWNKKVLSYSNKSNPFLPIYFSMQKPPKDEQELAIDYLVGDGVYKSTRNASQKILIMPPASGKTYCATCAIQRLQMRALIIVRTKQLKKQWVERILDYTTLSEDQIINIESSELMVKYLNAPPKTDNLIFVATRSVLISFCNLYGSDKLNDAFISMGIGIKIIDEVHQEYERTLFIDYMTNVEKTFYLTATFAQSEYANNSVFQAAFNLTQKLQFKVKKRHIIYLAILYNTHPNALIKERIMMKDRFDRFQYIDYQIKAGKLVTSMKYCMEFFLKNESGKALILSSKHSSCDFFAKFAKKLLTGTHTVCSFYTGNKVDNYKSYDVICATSQMLGTGEDIPELRFLFNTEPGRSLANIDQFSGRLRPYGSDEDNLNTIYVEFVDMGFPKVYGWYKSRKKLMDRKAYKCYELEYKEEWENG